MVGCCWEALPVDGSGQEALPEHRECLPTTHNHLEGPPDNSQSPKKALQPPPAYREGLPSSPRPLGGPSGLSWPSRRAFRQLLALR